MNKHLQQRVEELLSRYDIATLATCGQAGPQISSIPHQVQQSALLLFVPQGSDHLFNLELQPELVLLSPGWKLQGHGRVSRDLAAPHNWEVVLRVELIHLHILSKDGLNIVETIDF